MKHSTTQFITQMKPRELRRQRAKLREAYSMGSSSDGIEPLEPSKPG